MMFHDYLIMLILQTRNATISLMGIFSPTMIIPTFLIPNASIHVNHTTNSPWYR
jgi:hypothetical protein